MRAAIGDRIIIEGHRVGEPHRDCKVIEVRGTDGAPPYIVQWEDADHDSFFFPGPDAHVQHFEHGAPAAFGHHDAAVPAVPR